MHCEQLNALSTENNFGITNSFLYIQRKQRIPMLADIIKESAFRGGCLILTLNIISSKSKFSLLLKGLR